MATASLIRPGKRAAKLDAMIRTLKALDLHAGAAARRAWVSADRLASAMGLEPGELAAPLARAEADGLVTLRRTDAGRLSIRLTRIAAPRLVRRTVGLTLNPIDDCHQADLVLTVAGMPTTSPTVDAVAAAMNRACGRIDLELADAINSGWLDPWPDAPDGPSVVLTPLAAGRLGLAISEDMSRWLRVGSPDYSSEDTTGLIPGVLMEADVTSDLTGRSAFDDIADGIGQPDDLAIEAEDVERRAAELESTPLKGTLAKGNDTVVTPKPKRRGTWSEAAIGHILDGESLDGTEAGRVPRPNRFIGFNRSWPVMVDGSTPPRPWTRNEGPCPACGGRPIPFRAACLVCDAIGVQHLLDRIKSPAPPPEPTPIQAQCADSVRTRELRGGIS